jgi:hypothetical protein
MAELPVETFQKLPEMLYSAVSIVKESFPCSEEIF